MAHVQEWKTAGLQAHQRDGVEIYPRSFFRERTQQPAESFSAASSDFRHSLVIQEPALWSLLPFCEEWPRSMRPSHRSLRVKAPWLEWPLWRRWPGVKAVEVIITGTHAPVLEINWDILSLAEVIVVLLLSWSLICSRYSYFKLSGAWSLCWNKIKWLIPEHTAGCFPYTGEYIFSRRASVREHTNMWI